MPYQMSVVPITMNGSRDGRITYVKDQKNFISSLIKICVGDGRMAWIIFRNGEKKIRFRKRTDGKIANSQGEIVSPKQVVESLS